jgi:hypothetical protein
VRDQRQRLPFIFAFANPNDNAPKIFDFLVRSWGGLRLLAAKNSAGYIPLHFLLEYVDEVHVKEGWKNNLVKIILLYLDYADAPEGGYFSALRQMPQWLQTKALQSPGRLLVRELNKQSTKPVPTMMLMLDLYILITLIVCFQLAVGQTISCLYNEIHTYYSYIPL